MMMLSDLLNDKAFQSWQKPAMPLRSLSSIAFAFILLQLARDACHNCNVQAVQQDFRFLWYRACGADRTPAHRSPCRAVVSSIDAAHAMVRDRWRSWERSLRFVAVWGAFLSLTAFYLIPVILIQGLLNIDQLRRVHWIAVIIDLPVVRSIITAILPGAALPPGFPGARLRHQNISI